MKKILFTLIFTILVVSLYSQENWLSYNLDCQVQTEDGGQFSRDIIQWVEERGGYYTEMSPSRVILRFPWQELAPFREWLNLNSREIYRMDQSSRDLREEILTLRSGLEARQEILTKNMEYLDRSNFEGTLALEQEVRRLMSEIDIRQGQLRARENDRNMVLAVVNISFLTNSLPERGYSSFHWINGVDFYDFMDNRFPEREMKRVHFPLPAGFAQESKRWVWQALSPEGLRLRLRWVTNYPEMEGHFWIDVLSEDFRNRGYTEIGEVEVIEGLSDEPMYLSHWGIPYGQEDHHYTLGFMVRGNKILVLEFAGPILLLQEHADSVNQSIEDFMM